MATLSRKMMNTHKVLLREAKQSNLNLTPHTTVFHKFPHTLEQIETSVNQQLIVPGNRTGIDKNQVFQGSNQLNS